jgi:hypothetical protein
MKADSWEESRTEQGRDDFEQIRIRRTEAMPEASSRLAGLEGAEISRYLRCGDFLLRSQS